MFNSFLYVYQRVTQLYREQIVDKAQFIEYITTIYYPMLAKHVSISTIVQLLFYVLSIFGLYLVLVELLKLTRQTARSKLVRFFGAKRQIARYD